MLQVIPYLTVWPSLKLTTLTDFIKAEVDGTRLVSFCHPSLRNSIMDGMVIYEIDREMLVKAIKN
jgi:hypothetical protein